MNIAELPPIEKVEFENGGACLLATDFLNLIQAARELEDADKANRTSSFASVFKHRRSLRANNEYIQMCNQVIGNMKKGLYHAN